MIDINYIRQCETDFPKDFANTIDTYYGKLFYNADNKKSHDSNHAVILDLAADIDKTIDDIASFYENIKISPRIYSAYIPREEKILRPYFNKHGFIFREFDENQFFEWQNSSTINTSDDITIRRVSEIDMRMGEMIWSEDESDRTVKVLRNHLRTDSFHLLAGYLGDVPVTMGSVKVMNGLSRVDDVLTHKKYRGKGYSRALINHMLKYHSSISKNRLYLYASNPTAIKIYRETGFADLPFTLKYWSAWKESVEGY